MQIQAKRMPHDGTIGIICPSNIADMMEYTAIISTAKRLGFTIKLGKNVQKNTYGYAASAEERAKDLNDLVADDTVQMILFSGGTSGVEILPLIDYTNICQHPSCLAVTAMALLY